MSPDLNQPEADRGQRSPAGYVSRRNEAVVVLLSIPAAFLLMAAHYVLFRWMWGGDSDEYQSAFGFALFLFSDVIVVVWMVPKVIRQALQGSPDTRRQALFELAGIGMLITLILGLAYAIGNRSYYMDVPAHRQGFMVFSSLAYIVAGVFYTMIRHPQYDLQDWVRGWIAAPASLMLPLLISSTQSAYYFMAAYLMGTWTLNSAAGLGASLVQARLDKE